MRMCAAYRFPVLRCKFERFGHIGAQETEEEWFEVFLYTVLLLVV